MATSPAAESGSPVTRQTSESAALALQVKRIVEDLNVARPGIFWADFLISISVSWVALGVYLTAANFSLWQIGALVVCGMAIYRSVVFTHELAHRPLGQFRLFSTVWNTLCGVPFLVPEFLYGDHRCHHVNKLYGTQQDAEYMFLQDGRTWRVLVFLAQAFVIPLFGPIRFLLLTPLAAIHPALDRLIWTRASGLYNVMNPGYRRAYDAAARRPTRWLQEAGSSLVCWSLVAALIAGWLSPWILLKLYVLWAFWIFVNQARTLIAHRYEGDGTAMTYVEQLLDSYTFPRGVWAEIWAPLGMRYHALHHLVPSVPYHAMPAAHRRLMQELPADSPYRDTIQRGFISATIAAFRSRRDDRTATTA